MEQNEMVLDVKNKLKMYNPYTNRIKQFLLEIEEIEARMIKTQGSFVKPPSGIIMPNIHKNSPLFAEIEKLEEEINKFSPTIDQVNNFLDKLDAYEKDIIKRLYLNNPPQTQKQVGEIYNYEREGLRDKVDRMIISKWEY